MSNFTSVQFEKDYDVEKMRRLVDDIERQFNAISFASPGSGGGGGETTVHNNLTGRGAADAHPQSAITGLSTRLSTIESDIATNTAAISANDADIAVNVIAIADHEVRITALEAIVPQDLQDTYDAEVATADIVLDSTIGGLSILDNAVPIGASLFRVADNAGATEFIDVDTSRVAVGVNVLPDVAETNRVGTGPSPFLGMQAKRGYFINNEGGGALIQMLPTYYSSNDQGGAIIGNAYENGGTCEMTIYGNYPPIAILGNTYATAGNTAIMYNRGGGSLLVGSAWAAGTNSTVTMYVAPTSYGSFTGGYPYTLPGGPGPFTINNLASGSFLWGGGNLSNAASNGLIETTGYGAFVVGRLSSGGQHIIRGAGAGSFTQGVISGTAAHTMTATGAGSFVQGSCSGNSGTGLLTATGAGSFAQGRAHNGGTLSAAFTAAFAQGNSNNATLSASQNGSFAQGTSTQSSYLVATGSGGFAQGRCTGGSRIEAAGFGTFAHGVSGGGYRIYASGTGAFAAGDSASADIDATGDGSFAFGLANTGIIAATANNAVQFGPGTNAVADSLQVGANFRANASGQHAGARETITLGAAATTFAIASTSIEVTGDAGTNTIATITGGIAGQFLALQFVDALVTITDDNTHAADSVDLSAAFTSADDTMLLLWYDGTSWYEVSRSVN